MWQFRKIIDDTEQCTFANCNENESVNGSMDGCDHLQGNALSSLAKQLPRSGETL